MDRASYIASYGNLCPPSIGGRASSLLVLNLTAFFPTRRIPVTASTTCSIRIPREALTSTTSPCLTIVSRRSPRPPRPEIQVILSVGIPAPRAPSASSRPRTPQASSCPISMGGKNAPTSRCIVCCPRPNSSMSPSTAIVPLPLAHFREDLNSRLHGGWIRVVTIIDDFHCHENADLRSHRGGTKLGPSPSAIGHPRQTQNKADPAAASALLTL